MKYLNIAVIVSIVFFIGSVFYYNDRISHINTDFSKNYWVHPNNSALAGSYLEYSYVGRIVDSTYEGSYLKIKLSNSKGEKEFLLDESMKDRYFSELTDKNTGIVRVETTKYPSGLEQVNNISFSQSDV